MFGSAAPASSTSGGLFGSAAPTATTTSGGLFGSTAPASSAGGGLFGSAAPSTQIGGLFGASASAAPATPNPFGSTQSTSNALIGGGGAGLFGAAPSPSAGALTTTQQPGGLFQRPHIEEHPSSLDPSREMQEIINAYNPNHPDYKFRTYFYNVVKDPRMRVKPQNVSERKWRELLDAVGGENNPDCLWPVQYDGFEGLMRRKTEASTEIKAQEEFVQAVETATRQIMQWTNTEMTRRMQNIKNKAMEHQHRLIKVFRAINQQQMKSYADANGGATPPVSAEEIELLNRFKDLSKRVNRSAASLPRRAEALAAAARLRQDIAPADEIQISDEEKNRIMDVIEKQRAQIDDIERQIEERFAKREELRARRDAERNDAAQRHSSPLSSYALAPASSLFSLPSLKR